MGKTTDGWRLFLGLWLALCAYQALALLALFVAYLDYPTALESVLSRQFTAIVFAIAAIIAVDQADGTPNFRKAIIAGVLASLFLSALNQFIGLWTKTTNVVDAIGRVDVAAILGLFAVSISVAFIVTFFQRLSDRFKGDLSRTPFWRDTIVAFIFLILLALIISILIKLDSQLLALENDQRHANEAWLRDTGNPLPEINNAMNDAFRIFITGAHPIGVFLVAQTVASVFYYHPPHDPDGDGHIEINITPPRIPPINPEKLKS